MGLFPMGRLIRNKSASFFFFNTSKRGIVLDLESSRGKDILARLVADYDIVVAGESEEVLRRRGLAYADFRRWNPKIILTTVSGFGSFGPPLRVSGFAPGGLRHGWLGSALRTPRPGAAASGRRYHRDADGGFCGGGHLPRRV